MSKNMEIKVVIAAVDRFSTPVKHMGHSSVVLSEKLHLAESAVAKLTETAADIEQFKVTEKILNKNSTALSELQRKSNDAGMAMVKTSDEVSRLEEAMMDASYTSGGVGDAFKDLKKDLDDARKAKESATKTLEKTSKATKDAKHAIDQERSSLQKLNDKLASAGISTKNLSHDQINLKEQLSNATTAMEREATKVDKLEKSMARFDTSMQRASNISFVADSIKKTGDSISNALSSPLNDAIDFESSMAAIKKTTDFTPQGLQKFGDIIKEMTKSIPIAVTGMAEIAATGGQLGIDESKLGQFTVDIAKMATAFDMLPVQAANSMGKLANVYNIPINAISSLGDTINELSNNSPARANEIVDAMQRIGGTAKQFGLVKNQAAALSSTFIALGKAPEVASTVINSMLQKIQTAEKQGSKFSKALGIIGMNSTELAASVRDDAQGALGGLLDKLGQLDNQTRTGVLVDMFGTEFSDDIGTLVGSLGLYKKQLIIAANDAANAGSMEREFQTAAGTTANKIQLMGQRWDLLKIHIGERMIPMLERLMPTIETVVDALDRFVVNNGAVITAVIALAAGVGGVALVVAPVLTAIAALIGSLAGLGWAARKASIEVAARGGKKAAAAGIAKSVAGKAAGLGVAALAGYAIGTWFNGKINKAMIAATAGKNKSFGGWVYDKTHSSSPLDQQTLPSHVSARGSTNTTTIADNSTTHINITTANDNNPQAIKDAVVQALDDHKQQQASRVDGLMLDYQGAY